MGEMVAKGVLVVVALLSAYLRAEAWRLKYPDKDALVESSTRKICRWMVDWEPLKKDPKIWSEGKLEDMSDDEQRNRLERTAWIWVLIGALLGFISWVLGLV